MDCKGPQLVVVFVDALPWSSLPEMPFLRSMPYSGPMRPGFGYSINVKAELFAGLTPDDLGMLCEWMPTDNGSRHGWLKIGSMLPRNSIFDRLAHRVASKVMGAHTFMIPMDVLPMFKPVGSVPYSDYFTRDTVLRDPKVEIVRYSDLPAVQSRDKELFRIASERIVASRKPVLFVASADLDHVTHAYGIGSREHRDKVLEIDRLLAGLHAALSGVVDTPKMLVVSDHGMANVNGTVELRLDRAAGRQSKDRYLYFLDATLARIWIGDPSLEEPIAGLIYDTPGIKLLDHSERVKLGIASASLGDMIALADEGLVFHPSYVSRIPPAAMHGYHPDLASQRGLVVSDFASGLPNTTLGFHKLLHRTVSGI